MSKLLILAGMFVVIAVFSFFLMMLAWHWIVPDVFEGAVKQGLLPASLSFSQAVKLWILLVFLGISVRSSK